MAKKNYKSVVNPALQYISDDTEHIQQTDNKRNTNDNQSAFNTDNKESMLNADNKQYTHNDDDEIKSKRLNLLIYPSLLNSLKKIAHMQRRSVNELINDVLSRYAEQEAKTIDTYNKVFKD